jgi:uncharacterized protein (UPF0276 family)
MNRFGFSYLGGGLGLRRPHYAHVIAERPTIGWFEVIAENFMVEGGRPLHVLEQVRANYPIVLHGVGMSIGSADPLNREYLRRLAKLIQRFEPAWVSDHLCWTGVGGRNLHDLIPLPYTDEAVYHVARRLREVQELLRRHILIENVSSYLDYASSIMTEWDFLTAVANEADCGILLDINNIFVSAYNHRFSATEYIDSVPIDRVAQFHLAGHSDHGTYLLDTHDHQIRREVWELYEYAVRRCGRLSTLIERDDNIPEFRELQWEVDEAVRRTDGAVLADRIASSV